MARFTTKWNEGDPIYLKTDPEQQVRMITGFVIAGGVIQYNVAFCNEESTHFEYELSEEKDILLKMKN
jgi:hypothetical protein